VKPVLFGSRRRVGGLGGTRGHRRHRDAVPATSSSALPIRGLLPQNGTVTSSSSGSRWCLLVQPKLKARVGRDPVRQLTSDRRGSSPASNELRPSSVLLRKEVIQPHLPVRLPCYDFTPIADPTFDGSLPEGWATGFGCYQLSWCDGRCVQGPGTYSPQQC
jgi:hypothetical protein